MILRKDDSCFYFNRCLSVLTSQFLRILSYAQNVGLCVNLVDGEQKCCEQGHVNIYVVRHCFPLAQVIPVFPSTQPVEMSLLKCAVSNYFSLSYDLPSPGVSRLRAGCVQRRATERSLIPQMKRRGAGSRHRLWGRGGAVCNILHLFFNLQSRMYHCHGTVNQVENMVATGTAPCLH